MSGGAGVGARNFPEKRTIRVAHSKGVKSTGFPRKSGPEKGIPGPWPPHPGQPRAAPTCRADHLPRPRRRGARWGGGPDSRAPAALPPSPRTSRGPAAAYSPSRVERGGARHFRAQLRSARRTGWRRGAALARRLRSAGSLSRARGRPGSGQVRLRGGGGPGPGGGRGRGRTRLRTRPGSRLRGAGGLAEEGRGGGGRAGALPRAGGADARRPGTLWEPWRPGGGEGGRGRRRGPGAGARGAGAEGRKGRPDGVRVEPGRAPPVSGARMDVPSAASAHSPGNNETQQRVLGSPTW